jgi:predicted ester cyclase
MMTTSTQNNVDAIRRVFEALDRGDLDGWEALLDERYVVHFPGVPAPLRAAARQVFEQFFVGFPGLQHTVEDVWGVDDRVAVRLSIRGTQTGTFQGMPPSGKAIAIESINMLRMVNERPVEHWLQYDAVGLLQQLGAMPAPNS